MTLLKNSTQKIDKTLLKTVIELHDVTLFVTLRYKYFQKRQRMENFMQSTFLEWNKEKQLELELATATASIMQDNGDDHHKGKNENGDVYITQQNGVKLKPQNIEVEYVIGVSDDFGGKTTWSIKMIKFNRNHKVQ